MNRAEILQLASQHGLATRWLEGALRPTAHLVPGDAGASQLGGLPLLPEALPWPRWRPDVFCAAEIAEARQRIAAVPSTTPYWSGRIDALEALRARGTVPLSFLAQVDLGDLQRAQPVAHLPDHGLLAFFTELSHGAACLGRAEPSPPWQVHWFPDLEGLLPTASPGEGERILTAVPLTARAGWTLPDTVRVDGEIVLSELDDEAYAAFLEDLAARGVQRANHVDGHVTREQARDARRSAALQDAGFDLWNPPRVPLRPPLEQRVMRWQHLLQLATDHGTHDLVGVTTFWRHEGPWTPGLQPRVQQVYEQT